MPRERNSVRKRLEALREGKVLYTAKSARGLKERGKQGKKIPAHVAQDGIVMGDKPKTPIVVLVPETPPAPPSEPIKTPIARAEEYALVLIKSGVPMKLAVIRAADAYEVPRAQLAEVMRAMVVPP